LTVAWPKRGKKHDNGKIHPIYVYSLGGFVTSPKLN
jgi:hypothetical protein